MNESGRALGEAANFYKIPVERVIVLHDDLDLDPGVVDIKQGGGHGGHNGLKSIDAHIGKDYWRVRLGIGHPVKLLGLGPIPKDQKDAWVDRVLDRVENLIPDMVQGRSPKIRGELSVND